MHVDNVPFRSSNPSAKAGKHRRVLRRPEYYGDVRKSLAAQIDLDEQDMVGTDAGAQLLCYVRASGAGKYDYARLLPDNVRAQFDYYRDLEFPYEDLWMFHVEQCWSLDVNWKTYPLSVYSRRRASGECYQYYTVVDAGGLTDLTQSIMELHSFESLDATTGREPLVLLLPLHIGFAVAKGKLDTFVVPSLHKGCPRFHGLPCTPP